MRLQIMRDPRAHHWASARDKEAEEGGEEEEVAEEEEEEGEEETMYQRLAKRHRRA